MPTFVLGSTINPFATVIAANAAGIPFTDGIIPRFVILLGGLVIYSIVVDEESNVYAATPLGIFKLEQQ